VTVGESLLAVACACATGTARKHPLAKTKTTLIFLLIEILFDFPGTPYLWSVLFSPATPRTFLF
jgi:hypothetical protein